MSGLPPYASTGQRTWYYTFRIICGLIFFFLIAPILIIIPLSFNAEDFFTFTPEMLALIAELARDHDKNLILSSHLLRDVEQYSEVPRLSLFVGDDQHEPEAPVLPLSTVDPRAWRQPPKKASF